MHSVLVLVLISALQLCISFPAVAGDCFSDFPNSGGYDNCNTCYQTLITALINTGDNKFKLNSAFFPSDAPSPIEVQVTYSDGINRTGDWHWIRDGVYVINLVDFFFYSSLAFSRPQWQKESITLELPLRCFEDVKGDTLSLERLTERLKGYAESQTVIPEIDDTYMGWAVYGDDHEIMNEDIYGDITVAIIVAADVMALVFPILISCLVIFVIYHLPRNMLEKWMKILEQSIRTQGTLLSLVSLSLLITLYIIVMDIISFTTVIHSTTNWITVIFNVILDMVALVWVVCSGILIYKFYKFKPQNPQSGAEALTLCFSAPFFQIFCHIPSILQAWSTDPFYASKIIVYYAIFIFSNYSTVKYAYIGSLIVLKQLVAKQRILPCIRFPKFTSIIVSIISVIIVNGVLLTLAIFFGSIPVYTNTSPEASASGITAIFTIGVIIIGAIIVYNVGWHYLFESFSIQAALKKTMIEMETLDDGSDWGRLTEEGRMIKVLKALIHRQTLPGPGKSTAESVELTEIKTQ